MSNINIFVKVSKGKLTRYEIQMALGETITYLKQNYNLLIPLPQEFKMRVNVRNQMKYSEME